jgi:hypothetical protein
MIIQPRQQKAFVAPMVENFVKRMIRHLREHFSKQVSGFDDAQLRTEIFVGVDRAAIHGYESERDVCKFIDLMVVFGSDFDTNPDYEWTERIDDDSIPPHIRIDMVYDGGMASLEALSMKNSNNPS